MMYKLQQQHLRTEKKPKRIRQIEKARFFPHLVKLMLFLGRGDFVLTVLSLVPANILNFRWMSPETDTSLA